MKMTLVIEIDNFTKSFQITNLKTIEKILNNEENLYELTESFIPEIPRGRWLKKSNNDVSLPYYLIKDFAYDKRYKVLRDLIITKVKIKGFKIMSFHPSGKHIHRSSAYRSDVLKHMQEKVVKDDEVKAYLSALEDKLSRYIKEVAKEHGVEL